MKETISIRVARKKDVKSIVELLLNEIAKGTYATREEILEGVSDLSFRLTKNARKFLERKNNGLLKDKKARIFVAVHENKVVGFVLGNVFRGDGAFNVGYLGDTVVDKKWRGRRIFGKLAKAMDGFYKKSGARYVFFDTNPENKTMMKIGEHQGYKAVSVTMLKKLAK